MEILADLNVWPWQAKSLSHNLKRCQDLGKVSTRHLHVFLSQGSCLNPEDTQLYSQHTHRMLTFSMQVVLHYLQPENSLRDKANRQHQILFTKSCQMVASSKESRAPCIWLSTRCGPTLSPISRAISWLAASLCT